MKREGFESSHMMEKEVSEKEKKRLRLNIQSQFEGLFCFSGLEKP